MPLNYYTESGATEGTTLVWFLDSRYTYMYCHFPHILLFIATLATLLFVWLPYTLQLFLAQWLKRIPCYGLSRWFPRFDPVYDAYFAPLKHKTIGVYTSIAITFVIFLGILLSNVYHILHKLVHRRFKSIRSTSYVYSNLDQGSALSDFEEVTTPASRSSEDGHYRDSILDNESRHTNTH